MEHAGAPTVGARCLTARRIGFDERSITSELTRIDASKQHLERRDAQRGEPTCKRGRVAQLNDQASTKCRAVDAEVTALALPRLDGQRWLSVVRQAATCTWASAA
jgi:uncharacterized protein YhdP